MLVQNFKQIYVQPMKKRIHSRCSHYQVLYEVCLFVLSKKVIIKYQLSGIAPSDLLQNTQI